MKFAAKKILALHWVPEEILKLYERRRELEEERQIKRQDHQEENEESRRGLAVNL